MSSQTSVDLSATPRYQVLNLASTTDDISLIEYFRDAEDPIYQIRLADNPNCPAEVLEEFLNHPNALVRGVAKGNASLSSDVLADLVNNITSKPEFSRRNIARNPNLTHEQMEQLFAHNDKIINMGLLTNKSTNTAMLRQVMEVMLSLPAEEVQAGTDASEAIQMGLSNPHIPTEFLERLSFSQNIEWVRAIASNPSSPEDVLRMLLKQAQGRVVIDAIENPSTPITAIAVLLKDEENRNSLANRLPELEERINNYLRDNDYDDETISSLPLHLRIEATAEE